MRLHDWPSLRPQVALSKTLFGARGAGLLERWFEQQIERITDPAFARLFSDHINLPGIASGDYAHRFIQTKAGKLIGGIRFYSGDLARPFVEIVAHNFQDLKALQDCVSTEWAAFAPHHLRVLVASGKVLPPHAEIDTTIYAARLRDMSAPDNRVTLARFMNLEDAVALVTARYADLARSDPALARNIGAADQDDLQRWQDAGQLWAIRPAPDGTKASVGLFAASPGAVEWIEGDEVNEEIVLSQYSGHGLATSAQCTWAARADADQDRLLVGTIDGLNIASRRSAQKAGRAAVLDYVVFPIGTVHEALI